MKTTILTAILALLATLPMKVFPSFLVMEVEDKKDVNLDGKTEDDDKKSLTLPFGAYQEDNLEICVISYDDCPMVTLSIIDAYGNTTDTLSSALTSLQVVSFDISGYSHGSYTLVISTPTGTYLTGMFEI